MNPVTQNTLYLTSQKSNFDKFPKDNTINSFDIFFQTVIISVVFILIVLFIIFIVTKIKDYYRERT